MNDEIGKKIMITQDGVLVMKDKMCIPNIDDLRKAIMKEARCSAYAQIPVVPRCTEPSRKTISDQV